MSIIDDFDNGYSTLLKLKYAPKNFVGKRFGKLIVKERLKLMNKNRSIYYLCICDCGIEKVIGSNNLQSGNTKSCGCLKKNRYINA